MSAKRSIAAVASTALSTFCDCAMVAGRGPAGRRPAAVNAGRDGGFLVSRLVGALVFALVAAVPSGLAVADCKNYDADSKDLPDHMKNLKESQWIKLKYYRGTNYLPIIHDAEYKAGSLVVFGEATDNVLLAADCYRADRINKKRDARSMPSETEVVEYGGEVAAGVFSFVKGVQAFFSAEKGSVTQVTVDDPQAAAPPPGRMTRAMLKYEVRKSQDRWICPFLLDEEHPRAVLGEVSKWEDELCYEKLKDRIVVIGAVLHGTETIEACEGVDLEAAAKGEVGAPVVRSPTAEAGLGARYGSENCTVQSSRPDEVIAFRPRYWAPASKSGHFTNVQDENYFENYYEVGAADAN